MFAIRVFRTSGFLALLMCAVSISIRPASAATIYVFGTSEAEGCSLRAAIAAANTNSSNGPCVAGGAASADLIVLLDPGTYRLTQGELDITSDMVLLGQGADVTRVEPVGDSRVFDVSGSDTDAFLIGMTLIGGDVTGNADPDGGVVRVRGGARLDITDSTLRDGIAVDGGAISSMGAGRLSMQRVAIVDNRALGSGGGIRHGAAEQAAWINVTLSGNVAAGNGGGVATAAPLDLRASTLTRNRSGSGGGGIHFSGVQSNADLFLINNSVLAGNSDALGTASSSDLACPGVAIRGGRYNLVERSGCLQTDTNGTALQGDARLSPLWDFGDGVLTHAPLPGSVLIDAGAPQGSAVACPASDARGVARPASACDVGAHEQVFDAVVNTTVDAVDVTPGNGVCATSLGQCSLRAAVQEAVASGGRWMLRLPPGTFTLSLAGSGGAGGDLDVGGSGDGPRIALFGAGPDQTVVSGNGSSRIMRIDGAADVNVDVALIGLTLRDGRTSQLGENGSGGGLAVFDADLMLYETVLRDNHLDNGGNGGGLSVIGSASDGSSARAHIERSAILDNRARPETARRGGGLWLQRARVALLNSTVSRNEAAVGSGIHVTASHPAALVRIVNSTIADNRGPDASGLYAWGGSPALPAVVLRASVLARNTRSASPEPAPSDCDTGAAGQSGIISQGGNRVEAIFPGLRCELTGSPGNDLIDSPLGLNPRDDQLALPAHRLTPGSPALDAVSSSACLDSELRRVWRDQTDTLRPLGAGCDAGASEGGFAPVTDAVFRDGFEAELN